MKKHRALYDHNDQNYKNSVFVDKGWQEVSQEFNEPISDCKKKWRHLRSSLSRYLKSSKDITKNKNNKLKPYYLLTHMDFLIPYTKTLDVSLKQENDDQHTMNYTSEIKGDEEPVYDHEIIQEDESQNMDEDEDVVYEAYEIQEQPGASSSNPQKPQITLVRSSTNPQSNIPQLQPLTINTQGKSQQIQLNASQLTQITAAAHQQQQQQQSQNASSQHQHQQQHITTTTQQTIPIQNTIIPVQDDQSSADLNFFLALLPDIKTMNNDQKRRLRIGTLKLIDDILSNSST